MRVLFDESVNDSTVVIRGTYYY